MNWSEGKMRWQFDKDETKANQSTCVRPSKRVAYIAVLPTTGQTALNRILSFAYSTAIVLVAFEHAAFDALYQTKPGLGRMPAVDAI